VVINTSHVKRLARWKEGGRWTAEGTSDGGRSMELPAPASVLSPANLYEELKGLKTKYRKFIVTCMRSVTVKLPLWTPWGHMGGVDVWLHKLTLAMGSDVWSSRPTRRTSPLTGSHCIVGWISPRARSDASQQRKISYHCRESNHVACSKVTIPTELSDRVTRKSWEAVTQCPAPYRTTALCSEISHGGTLSSGVLTDTHSVTCSTLQQDGLAPVRGDAARPLFAKRGLVSHLQKTERIHVFQRTAHSFPNTLQF
jgi:hypothetical protein